jgi:hypothetical protein
MNKKMEKPTQRLKPLKRETKFEFFLNNSSIIGGLNASAS